MTYLLAQAYLEQAKADYESYKLLKTSGQPASQWLHFLQMAIEKSGKHISRRMAVTWSNCVRAI